MKNLHRILVLGCSVVALSACGSDAVVSPGTSGDIIINPAPTSTATPTPTTTGSVTPAAGCPTIASTDGLTDNGTLSGPTGEYRVCELPTTFDADDNLPFISGLLYEISGRTNVGTDQGFSSTGTAVTVSIEPGVILYGEAESFFVVNRGNAIAADGTASNPIIWTSRDNIQGLSSDSSDAQWGGVVLLGRAPVSDCFDQVFNTAAAPTANPQCQQQLEGTVVATPFGGTNSADSSGSFTFNQIRFSGFELQQSNELQSLTTGGVGSGTVINNLLSFNSSDDGVEFFGGSVNIENLAVIGASDDSLDVDSGAQARIQTAVVVQRTATGDSIIELDSPDDVGDGTPGNALPQTNLQVNNATFVQRSTGSSQAIRARGGPALGLTNIVIDLDSAADSCIRIDDQITLDAIIGFDSVVCDGADRPARGPTAAGDADVQAVVDAGTNNNLLFTLTLTNLVVNGAAENAAPAFDATARSSFFSASTFIGAVESDLTEDFGDWTCNSSILDFGSASGSCTSLPIT